MSLKSGRALNSTLKLSIETIIRDAKIQQIIKNEERSAKNYAKVINKMQYIIMYNEKKHIFVQKYF